MIQPSKQTFSTSQDFDSISIQIASPERIREWSHGEITKPETINYRTQRSEKNGLFDEKIFGPEKDYECFCGKYKGIRYRGIVCDRCGVEITRAIVRRERMGHIDLATPVAHIWFLRSVPSRISLILGLSAADVEKVVYFAGYIITKVNEDERARILRDVDTEYRQKVKATKNTKDHKKLKDLLTVTKQEVELLTPGQVLDENTYHRYSVKYGPLFEAGIGAEAVYEICKNLNLEKLCAELEAKREEMRATERAKLDRRLSLIKLLIPAGVRPEWMFMTVLPVIPPGLRPMVALEGGRHASSDLNDLYRRVINRNNRLKKLMDIHAPEVILRNEKRILQEAVDALIDNSIRHGTAAYSAANHMQSRPLKSLADYLKGKQGYFRQNLLGKRVDYSGRSVIVVGPELKFDECGLPKHMALELFRPFVIAELLKQELAFNIRGAGRLIEEGTPEVWAILEKVIEGKHVLLNRAPTLHRQGIQAFRPVLIEGNSIRVHPLVCPAFNADFDGDQMAVHVPLSPEAQLEAREIISANKNILKPGLGAPVIATNHDIALGSYWMTKDIDGEKGEGKYFSSPNEAITAYDFGVVGLRAKVKVLPTDSLKYAEFGGAPFETSVGRLLFNTILPSDYGYINSEMKKQQLSRLVDDLIVRYGLDAMPPILDKIKSFGFTYAMRSGVTWGLSDLTVPKEKEGIILEAQEHQRKIIEQYREGLLSVDERRRLSIEVWHKAKSDIEKHIPDTLDPNGSVHDLVVSGARGSMGQITQMAGMRGLMMNTRGETIEFPVIASMKEGLTPIEYFITTHGARKGLSDTALNTAKAGYLTRRLFDVAQDVVVAEKDCGTKEGIIIGRISASGIEQSFSRSLTGRVLSQPISEGKVSFSRGHLLSRADAEMLDELGIESASVRSPMSCKSATGICQNCYGADHTTQEIIDLGEAVGTVAAQAIGEPGTQLTMRTFHTGGVSSVGGDITTGLPRVEEVFERRPPKSPALVSKTNGLVTDIKIGEGTREKVIVVTSEAGEKKKVMEYPVYFPRMPIVKVGESVVRGDLLSDGSANIEELFEYGGKERTQEYIIHETSKIYELQGSSISRKHVEVIIRQMFARRRIKGAGDTELGVGDLIEDWEFHDINKNMKAEGKQPAVGETVVLGIQEASLARKSFLSASSFQHTTKVLINSSIRGAIDPLRGLKENVILGRLIPAGTGFAGSKKYEAIKELKESMRRARYTNTEPEPAEFVVRVKKEE